MGAILWRHLSGVSLELTPMSCGCFKPLVTAPPPPPSRSYRQKVTWNVVHGDKKGFNFVLLRRNKGTAPSCNLYTTMHVCWYFISASLRDQSTLSRRDLNTIMPLQIQTGSLQYVQSKKENRKLCYTIQCHDQSIIILYGFAAGASLYSAERKDLDQDQEFMAGLPGILGL